MFQSVTMFVSYTIAFLLMAQIGEAKYPVTILDQSMKITPRLYGVSTFVYNSEMYAYGGRTGLQFNTSNTLFKYSFDLEQRLVTMDTVHQKTMGPVCTFCGAVMISEGRMLVLASENAGNTDNASTQEIVKPYTFDLNTKEWSVPTSDNLPRYNETQKHVFVLRAGHATILGSDGCIYVVGGFTYPNITLLESWYYDPNKNEYGVISDNVGANLRIGSSVFSLPNGNIGVLFGFAVTSDLFYYQPNEMSVINTQTKTWENGVVTLAGQTQTQAYGVTVQTDANNNYAYFFGGKNDTLVDYDLNNKMNILDLKNNKWIETDNRYEVEATVKARYYSSSVIINSTFITVFGTINEDATGEMADLDIVILPDVLINTNEIPPQNVTVTWKSGLDQKEKHSNNLPKFLQRSKNHIRAAMAACFIIYIIFLFFSKVSVKTAKGSKIYTSMPRLKIKNRAGELFATELYRIFVQLIGILIFGCVLGYLTYNTANSSISETEDFEDVPYLDLPDIRFCYAGYDETNSSVAIPHTTCQYDYTLGERDNCTLNNIKELPKSMNMPTFPKQQYFTKCYLYKSSNDSMRLDPYNPTVLFTHIGGAYYAQESVFVQFYEPSKNPNRVLFFNESLPGFGIEQMDKWKDSERNAGTSNEVMHQILFAYPDSDISVQFEIVERRAISDSPWNYFGLLPKYNVTTKLEITHNDPTDRGSNFLEEDPNTRLGSIRVTPTSFRKRIIVEQRNDTIVTLLGNIGGAASVLLAAYALLFGAKPNRPWGIVHKTNLIAIQKHKKLKQLEDYFDIKRVEGIPLVTPVHRRYADLYAKNVPDSENVQQIIERTPLMDIDESKPIDISDLALRVEQLEGRNQILELVLRAYYVDVKIFQQLDLARQQNGDSNSEQGSDITCNASIRCPKKYETV